MARKTRESVILCEAAGFDVIFIETVGVGQSETAVHSMVDLFLLIQISGAGDELQGIKRGIMEMADMVAINKADGDNRQRAELTRRQFLNALSLFPMPESEWKPRVYTTSSTEGTGLTELWGGIEDYLKFTRANGYFDRNRSRQAKYWMYETIDSELRDGFYKSPIVEPLLAEYERRVLDNRVSSFAAAHELLAKYYAGGKEEGKKSSFRPPHRPKKSDRKITILRSRSYLSRSAVTTSHPADHKSSAAEVSIPPVPTSIGDIASFMNSMSISPCPVLMKP